MTCRLGTIVECSGSLLPPEPPEFTLTTEPGRLYEEELVLLG